MKGVGVVSSGKQSTVDLMELLPAFSWYENAGLWNDFSP
jgi:hypothetical protein